MAATGSSNEKPYGIAQIKAYIPISLDMEKLNYDVWRELFETHCVSFGVSGHIDGSTISTPDTAKEWKERDGLVKMWIYGTISDSIIDTVLKKNSTAHELWLAIENLFRDNKEARALQLENDLRTTVIGDLSVHDYCKKMKTFSDLLANVDSPISERVLVMHLLNGLSDKFDYIINVIKHKSPFPGFLEARSMLQSEEDRLAKQIKPNPSHQQTPSSSTLLYTATDDTRRSSNYNHSGRGHRGRNNNNRGGGCNRGRGRNNNSWSHNHAFPPWNYHQQPWQPPYYSNMMPQPMYPSSGYPLYAPPPTPYNHSANSGLLGPRPARPNNEAHMVHSTVSSQLPAGLTQAFNTMTLNEPDNSWYMDSGASNHIASGSGSTQSEHSSPM